MNDTPEPSQPVESPPTPSETPLPSAEGSAAPVSPEQPAPQVAESPAGPQPAAIQVVPVAQEEPAPAPANGRPAAGDSFWARPGWWSVILVGLVSSCLGVFLTLAVLGILNHGLVYAAPADVSAVQAQVDNLQTRLDGLEQDVSGLRTRVEKLEELAARTTALENLAANLQSEIDKRVAEAQTLSSAVDDMKTKVAEVVTQSQAFQAFINGLRGLLNQINPGGK
jgi:uncharacterized protein YoxC